MGPNEKRSSPSPPMHSREQATSCSPGRWPAEAVTVPGGPPARAAGACCVVAGAAIDELEPGRVAPPEPPQPAASDTAAAVAAITASSRNPKRSSGKVHLDLLPFI